MRQPYERGTMQFQIWAIAIIAAVPAAVAANLPSTPTSCPWSDTLGRCKWEGTAPFCGTTTYKPGDKVDGKVLVAWTRDESQNDLLFKSGRINKYCYDIYGGGCWSGYKRLWCEDLVEKGWGKLAGNQQ